jgi:hypothetical protein
MSSTAEKLRRALTADTERRNQSTTRYPWIQLLFEAYGSMTCKHSNYFYCPWKRETSRHARNQLGESLLHIASRGWTSTMPNCRFITSAACRAELTSKACWTVLPNSALRQLPMSRTPAATHYLSVCSKGSKGEMCRQYTLLPKAILVFWLKSPADVTVRMIRTP